MVAAPDIAGFVAASQELRQLTGDTITFVVPQPDQWPVGTRINPDTGKPYDAMVQPVNAPLEVTIRASVILKEASPLRPQADTQIAAVGEMSGMDIILDLDANDYPTVQAASDFIYSSRTYHIEEWKPFAINDVTYRYLCYGKEH